MSEQKGRNIMRLSDPERIAIKNRLGKTIRWLGEHVIPKDFLVDNYGENNPVLALLNPDENQEVTLIEAIALGVFDRAMKGDIRAVEFIRDTIGEKPATNINVTNEGGTNLSALTAEQLTRLAAKMDTHVPIDVEEAVIIPSDPFEE